MCSVMKGKGLRSWISTCKENNEAKDRLAHALKVMQKGDLYLCWDSWIARCSAKKRKAEAAGREEQFKDSRNVKSAIMAMKMQFMYHRISSGNIGL